MSICWPKIVISFPPCLCPSRIPPVDPRLHTLKDGGSYGKISLGAVRCRSPATTLGARVPHCAARRSTPRPLAGALRLFDVYQAAIPRDAVIIARGGRRGAARAGELALWAVRCGDRLEPPATARPGAARTGRRLARREQEVLLHVARGETNPEIALAVIGVPVPAQRLAAASHTPKTNATLCSTDG